MKDFDYLGQELVYLDAACQSLRPRPVVEALERYYFEHNSCGERVKYAWGEETDRLVEGARRKTLKFLKLREKDYFVSFTLNTTYGLNLILNALDPSWVRRIMTSEMEHNSPFLATMAAAERLGVPRLVLRRKADGALCLDGPLSSPIEGLGEGGSSKSFERTSDSRATEFDGDFSGAVVVVGCMNNFDGRLLANLDEVIRRVHEAGGIVVVDAAQALAHAHEIIEKTQPDPIFFSAHKAYASSLGVMVVRRDLLAKLRTGFMGGGMVDDVFQERYLLSAEKKEQAHTIFEPGLQAWGEIVAFSTALDWLTARTKAEKTQLGELGAELKEFLAKNPRVHLVDEAVPENCPTTIMSFYVEGLDSHLLGAALGREQIMARTGYFCDHYYLDKVLGLPPLVRFSLSYATRPSDIAKVKQVLGKI